MNWPKTLPRKIRHLQNQQGTEEHRNIRGRTKHLHCCRGRWRHLHQIQIHHQGGSCEFRGLDPHSYNKIAIKPDNTSISYTSIVKIDSPKWSDWNQRVSKKEAEVVQISEFGRQRSLVSLRSRIHPKITFIPFSSHTFESKLASGKQWSHYKRANPNKYTLTRLWNRQVKLSPQFICQSNSKTSKGQREDQVFGAYIKSSKWCNAYVSPSKEINFSSPITHAFHQSAPVTKTYDAFWLLFLWGWGILSDSCRVSAGSEGQTNDQGWGPKKNSPIPQTQKMKMNGQDAIHESLTFAYFTDSFNCWAFDISLPSQCS